MDCNHRVLDEAHPFGESHGAIEPPSRAEWGLCWKMCGVNFALFDWGCCRFVLAVISVRLESRRPLEFRPGDAGLVHHADAARHIGAAVEEL